MSALAGGLEVWPMDLSAPDLEDAVALLSADELDRAARFRFPHLRDSFTIARATLRALLAAYLDVSPHAIRFAYNAFGKPSLEWPTGGFEFNVSHSGNLAVYAFGRCAALGVDVEEVREMEDALEVARRFFAPAEVADLESAAAAERQRLFFTCWVRKEAFVKARGEALSIPLDSFRVQFLPGCPPCLMDADGSLKRDWQIHELPMPAGFEAALACRSGPLHVRIMDPQAAARVLRGAICSGL